VSDTWQSPGYWLASDGKWYSPELHPDASEPVGASSAGPLEARRMDTPMSAAPWDSSPSPSWGRSLTATLPQPVDRFGPDADAFAVGPVGAGRRRRVSRRALGWGSGVLVALTVTAGIFVALSGQSPKWDPRVLGIVHFDEQHRGLTFKTPVKVEFLSNAQFNKQVSVPEPTSKTDRAAQSRALGELRALGLVHGNVNLAAAENKLSQSDIVGLYVDTKKTVFVRGTALTPYVKVTLAHELTHALQDQYFNLTKLRQGVKNGDDTALTALIEGDAVRDETLYEQSLSASDQQAYQKEQGQLEKGANQTSNVPEILSDMLEFPYAFGPTFVDSLDANGGTAAIDRAFRDPPVSEAQIANPVGYPIGWRPTRVAPPTLRTGERRVDKPSSFGQVSLFEVLGSRLGYDQAWHAVQGWQGDNSLPYKDQGRTCMAIDVAMSSLQTATSLTEAARGWSQAIPGATVTQHAKLVDVRSCDPGPNAPGPPTITPSAFDVLSARAGIIDDIMTSDQVDFALGTCVVDKILVGVGPSHYEDLISSSLSATQETQLRQLAESSATNCRAEGIN
jgi:hypothetical protein